MNLRTVYERYCDGENITDEEIREAARLFNHVAQRLIKLGPCFEVTRKECDRMYQNLQSIIVARGLKA